MPIATTYRHLLGRAAGCTAFGVAACLAACGSDSAPDSASAGSSNSVAGSAGNPSPAAGSAGTSSAAMAGAGAGGAQSAAGAVSAAGEANGGLPGNAGADAAGGNSAGGTAGLAGAANGGSSGAAGQGNSAGQSDDASAAAVLNHYQLLDPCQSSYKAKATPGDVCSQDAAVKNQHISLQFGGDAALTYNVKLRVRAIMEGYWFTGGTLDPTSKTFYTGGVPTVGGFSSACKNKTSELPFKLPTEVSPTDNCWNGFNMFAMTVSAPTAHYYLNYTADKASDRPPHAVYSSDYTVTIPIQGQAKIDYYIVGSDEHECYNFSKVVSGVSLTPSPYIGEFVQFDVLDVTRVP